MDVRYISEADDLASLNRVVMNRTSAEWIRALDPRRLSAAEISGNFGKRFDFKSYESFHYPGYDICAGPLTDDEGKVRKFDLILANQIWEHLDRPYAATRNAWKMLKKGGHLWLSVPFFVPYHPIPVDCSRWSARGLTNLLIEGGFAPDEIRAEQWGNRATAERNMSGEWPPAYDPDRDDLTNDPDWPIVTWVLARKT